MNSRVLEVPAMDGPFQAPFVQDANYLEFVARNESCGASVPRSLDHGRRDLATRWREYAERELRQTA